MRSSEIAIIRRLPLFKGITPAHFNLLTKDGFLQRFPGCTDIIAEGNVPDFLHIVVEGMVKLFASYQGRETVLDIVRPVSTFILAAVIRDEVYLKSARTLAPSRIFMIPAPAVRDVFGQDAAFARAVVNELALRYRVIVRTLKNDRLRTGTERLLNWILQADRAQGGRGRVKLPFDKRTLASKLGMTAENLSRSLTTLKKHGITARGKDIFVADRKALSVLAKPSLSIDG
jgi:CRP/FNR family transcriptional regulator, transcriptional activator FtrB